MKPEINDAVPPEDPGKASMPERHTFVSLIRNITIAKSGKLRKLQIIKAGNDVVYFQIAQGWRNRD